MITMAAETNSKTAEMTTGAKGGLLPNLDGLSSEHRLMHLEG